MLSGATAQAAARFDEWSRLREIIRERSLLRGGEYRLASGQTSDVYFAMEKTTLDPEGSNLAAGLILDLLEGEDVQSIGGLVEGAVPIVTAVSVKSYERRRPIPAFFVRKEIKGHGTEELIDGYIEPGWRVVLVDDVTTTGGSVLKAVHAVRERGCHVSKVITIVDRLEGAKELLAEKGLELISLFTKNEFDQ